MMTPTEKETIEQYLLGYIAFDESMRQEHITQVRNEMLAERRRRRQYSVRSKSSRANATGASRKLAFPLALLLLAVTIPTAGTLWVSKARATQRIKDDDYAARFVGSFKDYYQEDLLAADHLACEAEELLPGRTLMSGNSIPTQQVLAAAKASRCLFSARLGNVNQAIQTLQEAYLVPRQDGEFSDSNLLFDLCIGKATQVTIETLNGKRRSEEATSIRSTGLKFLGSAIEQTLASNTLNDDERYLLAAALSIDTARIYLKAAPIVDDGFDVPGEIDSLFHRSEEFLLLVGTKDAAWWGQMIRIQACKAMLRARSENRLGIQRANSSSNYEYFARFLDTVPEFGPEDAYYHGFLFEKGILLSNLADLTSEFHTAESYGNDTVADARILARGIELRTAAIDQFSRIPLESRTERLGVNTTINHSRRMELLCRSARIAPRQQSALMLAASLDAAILKTQLGDVLHSDAGQLFEPRQAIAAALLGYSPEVVHDFLNQTHAADLPRTLADLALQWHQSVASEENAIGLD